jgi:hypothetical protein
MFDYGLKGQCYLQSTLDVINHSRIVYLHINYHCSEQIGESNKSPHQKKNLLNDRSLDTKQHGCQGMGNLIGKNLPM